MKHLYIKFFSLFIISLLIGCTSKPSVSPSQNSALSNITNSNKTEKNGYMQKSLDSWLKNDWEPTLQAEEKHSQKVQKKRDVVIQEEKIAPIKEKNSTKDDESFTLQKYVDKASIYMKAKKTDEKSAHYKQIESLPAIGK